MKTRRHSLTLALPVLVTGCFAVTNLDRFQGPAKHGSDLHDDLVFTVTGMDTHPTQLFEYRVIDANNFIQSRGFLDPLGAPRATVHVPRAVPKVNGPYRLDFYADKNHSGSWDGLASGVDHDHGWRWDPLVDSPPSDPNDGVIDVTYAHNYSFSELNDYPMGTRNPPKDTGVGAVIHMLKMDDYAGKLVQVRVADANTGHTAGLYRFSKLTLPIAPATLDANIPGVIDEGVNYNVEVYVDANGNGTYEAPPGGDLGWRIPKGSDATGLSLDFDPHMFPAQNVDLGPP
jgi:hypothetical protein